MNDDLEQLLAAARTGDEPTAWFDRLYAAADGDAAKVPWARLAPHPYLARWLSGRHVERGRAIVVGCGLGDDAHALAEAGFEVTAFDVADRAVAWARERFPHPAITWATADLFALPETWHRTADVIWEARTVQSLPPHLHTRAAAAIAGLLADGGELVAVLLHSENPEGWLGPPWPVTEVGLRGLLSAGLEEHDRVRLGQPDPNVEELALHLRRPG